MSVIYILEHVCYINLKNLKRRFKRTKIDIQNQQEIDLQGFRNKGIDYMYVC